MIDNLFRKIKIDGEVPGISPLYALSKHIIVGFSGGADSSLLLEYLVYMSKTEENFPEIHALHVNHMLRGDESDGDEAFCRERCEILGVPLTVKRVNIPEIMAKSGLGAEECARNERYRAFREMADSLGEGTLIATAHNSDDNLETVLFNLARGGGAQGLSGIAPVRGDGVIRPLIFMGSDEIRRACLDFGIPYVTDSTNSGDEYTRNFIRHSLVPLLKKVNPAAADASVRAGITLREDEEYLSCLARDAVGRYLPRVISDYVQVPRDAVQGLPLPVLSRAVRLTVSSVTDIAMSAEQIRQCRRIIIKPGTSKVSLPDGVTFEVSKDLVSAYRPRPVTDFLRELTVPKGDECVHIPFDNEGFDLFLCRSLERLPQNGENIYKLSIHRAVRFDTIYGRVFARSRRPGDTLSLGGHTRRLKKMICDSGIPEGRRNRLPVIFDSLGVLLVPGLPERGESYARPEDYASGNVLYILYCLR